MAIFRCKMCGGELEIQPGSTVAECTYCGAKQTLPKLDDEKRFNLYDRANHFRRNNEFDKAMGIYEHILNEDKTDAEAYWSLVLCRYGIEYVEDPASHKRVPTVNRAQFTSIFDDEDYKAALEYADSTQRPVYEAEAAAINEIQKGILEISQKEEPFDVFICYKETDQNGRRTPDSVLANELYHELINEGFKVFFARITLEDKLGTAYEPYIFAALNSAKVMVVLGTKAEYFNAVWVKNEWSRYLSLIKSGAKKTLIPAYRDMDPYDLPDEFSHLQAQDMSKLGFMPDLVRGIKKLAQEAPKAAPVKETVVVQNEGGANAKALLERGNMALEDGEFDKANDFFEQVLNMDAHCGAAYLGQFLAAQKCKTTDEYVQGRLNATATPKTETLTACAEETGRINACVAKNRVDGYLTAETIRNLFAFDRSYPSTETSRSEQMETETLSLDGQKFLTRAVQFGKQVEVDALKEKVLSTMRDRLEKSKEDAESKKQAIIEAYNKHLNDAEERAEQMHEHSVRLKTAADKAAAEKAERERIAAEKKAEEERIAAEKREKIYLSSNEFFKLRRKVKQKENELSKLGIFKKSEKQTLTAQISELKERLEESKTAYISTGKKLLETSGFSVSDDTKILFGNWKDADGVSNPIEWEILDWERDRILLLATTALMQKPFHADDSDIYTTTWDKCTLRKWLNEDFLYSSFTERELKNIDLTEIPVEKNPVYDTATGNNTKDKIFLLSVSEVEKYLHTTERTCTLSGKTDVVCCEWWLRTPGFGYNRACSTKNDGSILYTGPFTYLSKAIRPALWINLSN